MALVLYTIPPSVNFSRNPIRFRVGTDTLVTTVGLFIQCRVSFATMGNTPAEVIRFPLTPDAQGLAEIDLQRICDRLMTLQMPTLTATIQKISTHSGILEVGFVEYSVDEPEGTAVLNAGSFTLIKGGISYERWTGQAWFANWYTIPRRLLSWFASERTISTWQQLWLSYLHLPEDDTLFALKTTVYFTDGTSASGPVLEFPESGAVISKHVYHLPAGYSQLGIAAVNPTKRVHYYTVGVYGNTTLVSELITCMMDYTPDYEQLEFVFFNSLGGLDTLRLKGEHQQQLNRDFDLVDINTSRNPIGAYILPANIQQNQVLEGRSFKGNIGLVDDIKLQDLRRELFLSNAIYSPFGSRWRPVNVLDKTVSLGKLNDQLREIDIEWSYAWVNENYTPDWVELGNEPAPDMSCPVATISHTAYVGNINFAHQPGPVDRYTVQLFDDATDTQVGETYTYDLPFGATISALWDDLEPETDYYFVVTMIVTATNQSQVCNEYAFTTNALVVDPPPSLGLVGISFYPDVNLDARIINIDVAGDQIQLDLPATLPLSGGNTYASGTLPDGTVAVTIWYAAMNNNTLSITDSDGTTQSVVVNRHGLHVFLGVVINDTITTTIEVA